METSKKFRDLYNPSDDSPSKNPKNAICNKENISLPQNPNPSPRPPHRHPLADKITCLSLKNLSLSNLENTYKQFNSNSSVFHKIEGIIGELGSEFGQNFWKNPLFRSLDFTHIRRCLANYNFDELDAYDSIREEISARKGLWGLIDGLATRQNGFIPEGLFVFGLDFNGALTIGIKMVLFKENNFEKYWENIYVFIFTIVECMMSDLAAGFGILKEISFVADFYATDFCIKPICLLMEINRKSFPGILKNIYLINSNLDEILQDKAAVKQLGTKMFKEKVFVLRDDFEEPLFKDIKKSTVGEIYGGEMGEVFDFSGIVWAYAKGYREQQLV